MLLTICVKHREREHTMVIRIHVCNDDEVKRRREDRKREIDSNAINY